MTIVYKAIGTQVDAGDTVIYNGVCDDTGVNWTLAGSITPKFLPSK